MNTYTKNMAWIYKRSEGKLDDSIYCNFHFQLLHICFLKSSDFTTCMKTCSPSMRCRLKLHGDEGKLVCFDEKHYKIKEEFVAEIFSVPLSYAFSHGISKLSIFSKRMVHLLQDVCDIFMFIDRNVYSLLIYYV